MIKDPSFVKIYISKSKTEPSLLILTHRVIGEKNFITINPLKHDGLQLVSIDSAIAHMVSSFLLDLVATCNGLLCFTSSGEDELIIICNPITKQHVSLPKPTITLPPESYARMLAFGFDPVVKKYKVVRVLYRKSSGLHAGQTAAGFRRADARAGALVRAGFLRADARAEFVRAHLRTDVRAEFVRDDVRTHSRVEVYTLDTDSWREVQGFNHQPEGTPAYANGVLYWLIEHLSFEDRILSFDLANEEFKLTPHPRFGSIIKLAELGGCLAVVDLSSRDVVEVFVLKDNGCLRWDMEYNIPVRNPQWQDRNPPRLICVNEVSNVLIVWLEDNLLSYDKRAFCTRYLKIAGLPSWLDWDICSGYRGSLVPPGNSHATGNDLRDAVRFISDNELCSLIAKGSDGEQKVGGRCDSIVASFYKNGLLL